MECRQGIVAVANFKSNEAGKSDSESVIISSAFQHAPSQRDGTPTRSSLSNWASLDLPPGKLKT